jgi:signal peptidase II
VNPRLVGGGVALGVFVADQAAKVAVLSSFAGAAERSTAVAPFLDLALRWNRGISFSLFVQNSAAGRAALLAFTAAAVALLIWWLANSRTRLAAVGLGAIIGGALGNAIDRIVYGAVVDYLDLHLAGQHLFVFNLADAAINIGVLLLVIDLVFRPDLESRSMVSPQKGEK